MLGTISEDVLTEVVGLIAESDAAGAFALAGDILESGKDVRQFLKSLSERFRDLLFVGVGASATDDLDNTAALQAQSARFAPAALLHALETITAAEQETRRSSQHRLILELALLRLMQLPASPQFATPLPGEPKAQPLPKSNGMSHAVAAEPASPPAPKMGSRIEERPGLTSPAPLLLEAEGASDLPIPYDIPPPLTDAELSELPDEEDDEIGMDAPVPGDEELDVLPLDVETEDIRPSLVIVSEEQQDGVEDFMHVQQVAMEDAPPTEPKPPAADVPPELLRLQKSWQEVVNLTGAKSKTAGKDVSESKPVDITGNTIILEFAHPFHFERVQSKEALRQFIAENICRTLEAEAGAYRVKCVMHGQALPRPSAASPARQAPPAQLTSQPEEGPGDFVQKVIAVFGGDLLEDEVKG